MWINIADLIDDRNDYTFIMLGNSPVFNFLDYVVVFSRWDRLIDFNMTKVIQENVSSKTPSKKLPKYHDFTMCSYYVRDGSHFDSLERPKEKITEESSYHMAP